jgi:hypothetical protein
VESRLFDGSLPSLSRCFTLYAGLRLSADVRIGCATAHLIEQILSSIDQLPPFDFTKYFITERCTVQHPPSCKPIAARQTSLARTASEFNSRVIVL